MHAPFDLNSIQSNSALLYCILRPAAQASLRLCARIGLGSTTHGTAQSVSQTQQGPSENQANPAQFRTLSSAYPCVRMPSCTRCSLVWCAEQRALSLSVSVAFLSLLHSFISYHLNRNTFQPPRHRRLVPLRPPSHPQFPPTRFPQLLFSNPHSFHLPAAVLIVCLSLL